MIKYTRIAICFVCALMLSACDRSVSEITHKTISPSEAKKIIDGGNYILVDVRTQEEFDTGWIDGAILMPDYEIEDRAKSELPDKDSVILIYCRSGRRSAEAAEALAAMGYKNIYDIGGIIDWPYGTVTKK